jgi:hypothetical protein
MYENYPFAVLSYVSTSVLTITLVTISISVDNFTT